MDFSPVERIFRRKGLDAKTDLLAYFSQLQASTDFNKYLNNLAIWLSRYASRAFVPAKFIPNESSYQDLERFLIRRDFESSLARGVPVETKKDFYLKNIQAYSVSEADIASIADAVSVAASWDRPVKIAPDKGSRMTGKDDVVVSRDAAVAGKGTGTSAPVAAPPTASSYEAEIIKLLKQPLKATDSQGIHDRKLGLIRLFRQYPAKDSASLKVRLKKPLKGDDLSILFQTRLHPATRKTLLGILDININIWTTEVTAQIAAQRAQDAKDAAIYHSVMDKSPLANPRYLDNIYEEFDFYYLNGAFGFVWTENGKKLTIVLANKEVEQDTSKFWANDFSQIFPDKQSALAQAKTYSSASVGTVCFFKSKYDVIVPTMATKDSMPNFFAGLPAMKQDYINTIEDMKTAFQAFGNYVNPIPFTQLNRDGSISMSADPFTLLNLLHLGTHVAGGGEPNVGQATKVGRLADDLQTVKRPFSGLGIRYTVTGAASAFEKIKGVCVYVLKDAAGIVLYVGEGDFFTRLREHIIDRKMEGGKGQNPYWGGEVTTAEVWATDLTKNQSLALEEDLIQQLNPIHNSDRMPYEKAHEGGDRSADIPKAQQRQVFGVDFGQEP